MVEQRIDRVRRVERLERISVVLLPQVEDCVGGRIVFAPGALRDLFSCLGDDETAQWSEHHALHERQGFSGGRLQRQHARCVLQHAQRRRLIDQTHAFSAAGVDRAAGEQHVERGGRTDFLRQPLHAVPCGDDAEHDFGKRKACRRVVERDDIPARQCEFEPAAHAEPVHHRGRRERQVVEFLQHIPACAHERQRLFGRSETGEFLDIRAGDKSGFRRTHNHALGRQCGDCIERRR